MALQSDIEQARVAHAIDYLVAHQAQQPSLATVAEQVGLSAAHFQREFSRWAGISPKQFLQHLNLQAVRRALRESDAPLLQVAWDSGLSGSGRLHDLCVHLHAMTPQEWRDGGAALTLSYSNGHSLFGPVLLASTERGLCHLAFVPDAAQGLAQLQAQFPKARLVAQATPLHQQALNALNGAPASLAQLRLHLRASAFQLKVWQALLALPEGGCTTYGELARQIGQPRAARAVGTAVGANPVAVLIPCHRVIQRSGALGGYRWDPARKHALLAWESARHAAEGVPAQQGITPS